MPLLRVGVIGTGRMGANHVRAFSTLRHQCDLVGVFDTNRDLAKEVAGTFGTRAFHSMAALLDKIDATIIAVPTSFHFQIAVECLKRGIHVLLEKPLASSLEEAETLIRLAGEHGCVLQVGHVERFNPAVQELKKILSTEEVIGLQVERLSPYDPRINDTDVIADLMIHDIDVVRFLLTGEPVSIQACGSRCASPFIDYAIATFRMDGGAVVNLTASRVTEGKVRRMTVTTRHAYIEMDYLERKITISRHTGYVINSGTIPIYRQESVMERVFVPIVEPLIMEVKAFLAAALGELEPTVTGQDGFEAMRWAEEVREHCVADQSF